MSQTKVRIEEAAQDDRILNAPVTVVMRAYGLSYPNANTAIRQAGNRVRKAKQTAKVETRVKQDALVTTCRTAEENYPNITVQAVESGNHAALGSKHGITRERVRQIAEAIRELARMLGKTERAVAEMAVKNKLPDTQREELESTISTS